MSILVIAAHPDDEVLGCGGTIARFAAEGQDVDIVILGEGMTSRSDDRSDADQSQIERLRNDSRRAASILGAREVRHLSLPDNRFDTVPLLDVVKSIERVLSDVRPRLVLTQHGGDLNIDHMVTFRATLTATRPVAGHAVHTVLAYEVPSSTEWAFQQFSPVFRPSYYVDVTSTINQKVEAMRAYETESRPFPHPRSPEALRSAASKTGSCVGFEAAEAFDVVRMIH